jgi:3-keto-L-gulonate-6-phosphate decarboxylase
MIDLLELDMERIKALTVFDGAIFCLHLPSDCSGEGFTEMIQTNMRSLAGARRIAAAGGVRLETIPFIKQSGIETAIVGGAITKNSDITKAVTDFLLQIL